MYLQGKVMTFSILEYFALSPASGSLPYPPSSCNAHRDSKKESIIITVAVASQRSKLAHSCRERTEKQICCC